MLNAPVVGAIATNRPLPYATLFHVWMLGSVLDFQVTSVLFEYNTLEPPSSNDYLLIKLYIKKPRIASKSNGCN